MIAKIMYKEDKERSLLKEVRRMDEIFFDASGEYVVLYKKGMDVNIPLSSISSMSIKDVEE